MQTLWHGSEGEAVRRGGIDERTFPGVIASQEHMLFLLVPDSEAEGAGKMLDALFAPPLPRGQQYRAVRHGSGLLTGDAQLQPQFYTVVETYICNQRGDVDG